MAQVLAASLAFPSVIFTVLLAVALVYWGFVFVGALDIDLLGGADADGHMDLGVDGVVKGSLEGATKGALEGAVKGSIEGAAKGAAEGLADADADADAGEGTGFASLFAALQLNRAPATVVLSLFAAFAWLTCVLGMLNLPSTLGSSGLPGWLLRVGLLVVAIAVALPLTSLAVRPLGPLFDTRKAESRNDLLGRVCVISTGRVDSRFGQATLDDGGAGLILDVRYDTPGVLRHGDRVLLVSWDDDKSAFLVEPMDDVLIQRRVEATGKGEDEAAASAPEPEEPAPVERARREIG